MILQIPLFFAWTFFAVLFAADISVDAVVRHVRAHPMGDAPASIVLTQDQGDPRDLPIGIFDSGIGGLTVLEAIKAHDGHDNKTGELKADGTPDFQGERFVYLGDQANMPYGNYASVSRTDFLRELILRDALFLLGRRWNDSTSTHLLQTKQPVKAIVIACNTATAYGLDDVREMITALGIPVIVIGVVEAGAQGLAETSENSQGSIAVMATLGTCSSNAYPKAIARTTNRQVLQLGSSHLAAAIEGDPSIHERIQEVIHADVGAFLSSLAAQRPTHPVDTLVLGCTHYPLVAEEITKSFQDWRNHLISSGHKEFENLVAPKLKVVNPAAWTAESLWRALFSAKLIHQSPSPARDEFYVSIPNPAWPGVSLSSDGSLTSDYKYSRIPGSIDREDTIYTRLTVATLPMNAATLVRDKLPLTWQSLNSPH